MKFNVSIWERETFLRNADVLVLGSGIVGVNAAISLKMERSDLDVLIVDRGVYPLGASTRNAGFACFGSVTELLDDLDSSSEKAVFSLLRERLEGLAFLRSRVQDDVMDYQNCGGFEVFDRGLDLTALEEKINFLNRKIHETTSLQDTFLVNTNNSNFSGLDERVIFNQYEGSLHPGKMMSSLILRARKLGVRFLNGTTIKNIKELGGEVVLESEYLEFKCGNLLMCTNGFTNLLVNAEGTGGLANDQFELKPARNQILVTQEIPDLNMNSCYHYDKGYVYFRNVGKRVLIGGGRNIGGLVEETSDFGSTAKIRSYLMDILLSKIGLDAETKIDFEWSGILGVGPTKSPILKKHSEHIIFAVRLGGMGVALGSRLGDRAAKLLLKNI